MTRYTPGAELDFGREAVQHVIAAVARRYGLRRRAMIGSARHRRLTEARAVAMYLSRRRYAASLSYPELGAEFGRHHSSVLSAERRIARLIELDEQLASVVAELERELDPALLPRAPCVARCDSCGQPIPEMPS